jgi:putative flippase GtrA
MHYILKRVIANTLFRYVLIGGVSFVIEIAVLYSMVHIFNLSSLIAVAVSFWVGLVISFILQKIIAFQDKDKSSKKLLRQSMIYISLVIINYFFTIVFVAILESTLGLLLARTVALIITTSWNFIIYSKIIFKVS